MLERAVFLDRDNTIIENDGYLGDPSKVKLLPGAATALAAMRGLGYRLIVVSNQSGVARGMFDEAAVEAVNTEMSRQLQEQGGSYIDASYYCPYHPEAPLPEYRVDHDWRKPRCGMLKQAATDFRLDLAQSWMIGDQNRDIAAGAAAGCRTILLKDPDRNSGAVEPDMGKTVSPGFVVRTLADAARIIAREGRNPPPAPIPAAPAVTQPAPAAGGQGTTAPQKPVMQAMKAEETPETKTVASSPANQSTGLQESAGRGGNLTVTGSAGARRGETSPASAMLQEESPEKMAERVARQVVAASSVTGSSKTERLLEELVVQLRQQNRHAELHPEFSYSNIAALILQILAAVALLLGIHKFMTARVSFKNDWSEFFLAQFDRQEAMIWVLLALTLQGMVLALLVRSRRK